MQDGYAGDVGDFGKFGLVRALCQGLHLGLVWYYNSVTKTSGDGNLTNYSIHRDCDPDLYDRLALIAGKKGKSISDLQDAGILPQDTCFYSVPLPTAAPALTRERRERAVEERHAWCEGALKAVAGCDVIFLDPDNGLAPNKVNKWAKRGRKYVFPDELWRFLESGRTVILYQHQRRQKIEDQIARQLEEMRHFNPSVWPLSFHIRSNRIYYVFPGTERINELLWKRTLNLLAGRWGQGNRFRSHRPVWVFGYGSLIWDCGGVRVTDESTGFLKGWSRAWTWISTKRRHGAPTAALVRGGRVRGKFLNLDNFSIVSDLEAFRRRERRATEQQCQDVPSPGAVTHFWTMGNNLQEFRDLDGLTGLDLIKALARRACSIREKGPDNVTATDYIRRVHEFDLDDDTTTALADAVSKESKDAIAV